MNVWTKCGKVNSGVFCPVFCPILMQNFSRVFINRDLHKPFRDLSVDKFFGVIVFSVFHRLCDGVFNSREKAQIALAAPAFPPVPDRSSLSVKITSSQQEIHR